MIMSHTQAAPVDPRLAELVGAVLMGSPVAQALGIELRTLAVDHAVLELPFRPANVTRGDTVHGGVVATLIDVAAAAAAASGADPGSLRGGATGSLAISYLAPAEGVALRAEARVVRRGRRQAVSDVAVSAGDLLVAKALVTSALF